MIKLQLISSLEKIYKEDLMDFDKLKDFSMLKGEKKSFQIMVDTDSEFNGKINLSTNIEKVSLYSVEYIPGDFPIDLNNSDDYYRISKDGIYPDLLLPVNSASFDFKKGRNVFWVDIFSGCAGLCDINVSVISENGSSNEESLNVEVIDAELDFEDFIYTNWFHSDCLMSYYKIEAFSDEYWRIVKNYIKTAIDHGMNCILTPVFTPPLDTAVGGERPTVQLVEVFKKGNEYSFSFEKLDKWINTAAELGIKYFEFSHLFTQWGAKCAPKIMAIENGKYKKIFGWETASDSKEYTGFLTDFALSLDNYIAAKGIKDKVLLHISDEPNQTMIECYAKASGLIHSLFKNYKIIDAISDIEFYKLGLISNPIVVNSEINGFIGKVDNLWTYYCCGPTINYVSNRMFCHPSLRNRVLGCQLFKYDIKGFLHWGYNFYYNKFSIAEIDPYKVTDAGKAFPAGDPFVVYPAPDGTAYTSLRLKVFYDALQDMAAFKALAKLVGKDAVLEIIEKETSITFENYPHSNEWLLNMRESINSAIKKALKK